MLKKNMFNIKTYPKVFAIADYFIQKNQESKKGLTNKKLQKLLYYSQAWSLVIRDQKLFNDKIEAWIHGPAIPSVYFEYKNFGYNNIKKQINPSVFSLLNADEKELLDNIWEVYGKYPADYLEVLSHNETPWLEARGGLESYKATTNIISLKTMKQFYGEKLKKAEQAS